MSVIQNIRDKYARWAVIMIALSLLGFILMDAFAGRTGLFSGNRSNTVGKINGKNIDYQEFALKVDNVEKMQKAQGYEVGEAGRQQVIQQVWDQQVSDLVLQSQYDELGLSVSEKELRDILYGTNPPQDLKQRFTDPATGVYNGVQAQQFISQIKKQGTQQDKDQLNQYLESLEKDRMQTKYTSLLTNTIYFPKWFIEKRNVDNSMIGKISYVNVPYVSVPDSTVKISDSEIESYVSAHKKEFEQKEETRSISYVSFSAAPSSADTAAARQAVLNLKPQFDTVTNYENFLGRNSALPYFDGYLSKNAIQNPNKDSIINQPVGVVYGPYLDQAQQSAWVLSKIVGVKSLPDSVKCRHILIGTVNPQTGQPTMPDSIAKFRADSIAAAISRGANFDSLETAFSTDQAAHKEKGVMTFSSVQAQGENFAKEFGDFILNNAPGTKKVVKTQFGYHYIEIMEHKNVGPHYKIAYLAKPIEASDETISSAQNAATLFAGDSRNEKSFNENWEKNLRSKGINKAAAQDIKPLDFSVMGMNGTSRKFVRDIFEADKGSVVGPERVGDAYVVALVTGISKAGVMDANAARTLVEPILRNKKKAEQIKKNIGSISTLEAVAQKVAQPLQTADSIRFNGRSAALGFEPKVIGAAFNPANKGKVCNEAIEGQMGVYVIRVENTGTTPIENANVEQIRQMMEQQTRQSIMQQMQFGGGNPLIEPLKRAAKIQDNRSKFY